MDLYGRLEVKGLIGLGYGPGAAYPGISVIVSFGLDYDLADFPFTFSLYSIYFFSSH